MARQGAIAEVALTDAQASELAADAKPWARTSPKFRRKSKQVVIRAVLDANVYVSATARPEGPPGQIINRFLQAEPSKLPCRRPSRRTSCARAAPTLHARRPIGPFQSLFAARAFAIRARAVQHKYRHQIFVGDPDPVRSAVHTYRVQMDCTRNGDRCL